MLQAKYKTGLVFFPAFDWAISPTHPEREERLLYTQDQIREEGLLDIEGITEFKPDLVTLDDVRRVHFCVPDLWAVMTESHFISAGGAKTIAMAVMDKQVQSGFALVRPPGHHAERDQAMGFCYFNNVAVAARYLQNKWGIQRVGIVDFDVHHGNGTQHIFEDDPTVFYYSIHEHPSFAYPGTGREFENGKDIGQGYTKNSPVLPGRGDDEYRHLIKKDLLPAFDQFRPEVILVSAGFDAHIDDEMADMQLSTEGFSWIMQKIVEMGKLYSKGRIISILEGGYSLKRLPELAKNHVEILLNA